MIAITCESSGKVNSGNEHEMLLPQVEIIELCARAGRTQS